MPTPWPTIVSLSRELLSGFTQLVYPNACWVCANFMPASQASVCASCLPALTIDPFPTCPRCSSTVGPHSTVAEGCPECRGQSFAFDGAFRMAPYEGLLREVILRMKHWNGEDLAEVVGTLWAQTMAPRLLPSQPDVVIPIPLHWWRRWQRGYNQCDVLAACLAKRLNIPCFRRGLRLLRPIAQQKQQQSAKARRENVHHAFEARAGLELRDKTVLLVDDVFMLFRKNARAARLTPA